MGIALPFQVIISSRAHEKSTPITLSQICLKFQGGLRDIWIYHDNITEYQASAADSDRQLYEISLQKSDDETLVGKGEITLSSGVSKIFSLAALPLDAGDAKLSSIVLCCATEHFQLDFLISNEEHLRQDYVWAASTVGLLRMPLHRERNLSLVVLPKPPKIRVEITNLAKAYFTNEYIALDVNIINDEEEHSSVELDVRLLGPDEEIPIGLRWASEANKNEDPNSRTLKDGGNQVDSAVIRTLSKVLGQMSPSEARKHAILFQAKPTTAQCSVEIKARYHLLTEPETPIAKTLTLDMHFMRPFEANFDFKSQVSREPWPSYFRITDQVDISKTAPDEEPLAEGLSQRWSLTAGIASFASHPLVVKAAELQVQAIHEKAVCRISPNPAISHETFTLSPNDIHSRTFILDLQKVSLDDRLTTYFDLQLLLTWRRDTPTSPVTTTLLPIPELVIPFGEPRVLASAESDESNPHVINLDYILDNPSMHVLSFSISMEASEDFAFSGPKATAVQLVPLSRHVVRYKLLPLMKGKWISPQIKVLDVHWNKILKPVATGDMKSDRRGVLIWVDAEE